jgi:hypothetical protein
MAWGRCLGVVGRAGRQGTGVAWVCMGETQALWRFPGTPGRPGSPPLAQPGNLAKQFGVAGRFLRPADRTVSAACRGRTGLFFRLTGRGGHLGGPATKWGGRGRPAGHAALPPPARPPAVRR